MPSVKRDINISTQSNFHIRIDSPNYPTGRQYEDYPRELRVGPRSSTHYTTGARCADGRYPSLDQKKTTHNKNIYYNDLSNDRYLYLGGSALTYEFTHFSLPDNTVPIELFINIYIRSGETGEKTVSIRPISGFDRYGQALPTRDLISKTFTHNFKTGWNKIDITDALKIKSEVYNRFTFTVSGGFKSNKKEIHRYGVTYFDARSRQDFNPPYDYFLYCSGESNYHEQIVYDMDMSSVYLRSDSIYGTYAPYIDYEYNFNPPEKPTSLSPNKTTENPRSKIRFAWDNKYIQTKFEFQYKVGSGVWKSVAETTSNKYYEMPYSTIKETTGTLQWRVRVAGENDVFSEWEIASFELGVEEQQPPRIVSPSGDYIESSRPIRYEWQFVKSASEEQYSYDLEYTLDKSLGTTKIISNITSDEFYTLEHDHNSSTIAKWRIRVTNNYEEVSEWTDWAEFNIMGAPPIPQILEVSNTNIPTMKWNSKEQEVFEIFIFDKDDNKIYETGKIIGEEIRAYKLNTTLINGKYKFALIVYNKYDVASPQAEFTIIINPEPIAIPEISVHENDYYIYVRSSIENGQVFRNNHHIGDLINGEFYDYTGANNKLYNYKVRNIVDGVTADSESKSASVNFIYSTLALMNKPDEFIKLDMSLDKLPEQSININYDNAQFQLDGRKYPVTEFSDRVTETINIEYFVWQIDEMRKLLDAKEEMIYRDDNGYVFIGVSTGIGYNNLFFGKNTSLTMTKSRDEYD